MSSVAKKQKKQQQQQLEIECIIVQIYAVQVWVCIIHTKTWCESVHLFKRVTKM